MSSSYNLFRNMLFYSMVMYLAIIFFIRHPRITFHFSWREREKLKCMLIITSHNL